MEYPQHGQVGAGDLVADFVGLDQDPAHLTLVEARQSLTEPRLARDAPDLLERVESGEIKSARAAAIKAGIIKNVPTVRLTSPDAVADRIRLHWDEDQIRSLVELLLS